LIISMISEGISEGFQKRAVGGVPELEGVVSASRDDEASIGGERDTVYSGIMSVEGSQQRAVGGVGGA
jgi:hypothetical protein